MINLEGNSQSGSVFGHQMDHFSIDKNILEMLAKRASIPMTGEQILKQFQTSTVVYTIFKDGSCWKQVAPLTQFQSDFIQTLGLPDPGTYLKCIKME
jgi:hypothetical protein